MNLKNDKEKRNKDANGKKLRSDISENLSWDSSDEKNLIPFNNEQIHPNLPKSLIIKDKALCAKQISLITPNNQFKNEMSQYFQPPLLNQIQNVDYHFENQNSKSKISNLFPYKTTCKYFINSLNKSFQENYERRDALSTNVNNDISQNRINHYKIKTEKEDEIKNKIFGKFNKKNTHKKLEIDNIFCNSISVNNLKTSKKSSLKITGLTNDIISFYNKKANINVNNRPEYLTHELRKSLDIEEIYRNLQKKLNEKNSKIKQLSVSPFTEKEKSKLINYSSLNIASENNFQSKKHNYLKFNKNTSNFDCQNCTIQTPFQVYGYNLCLLQSFPSSNSNSSSVNQKYFFPSKGKPLKNFRELKSNDCRYSSLKNVFSNSNGRTRESYKLFNHKFQNINKQKCEFSENSMKNNTEQQNGGLLNANIQQFKYNDKRISNQLFAINKSQNIDFGFLKNEKIQNNKKFDQLFNRTTIPIEDSKEYSNNSDRFKTSYL